MSFSTQSGATLIEVLISVLILSVGGLGVASMQLAGLKYSSGAQTRTQASLLANDLFDRIRSNRSLALDKTAYNTNSFEKGTGSLPSNNCYQQLCDADELASFDKNIWLNQVSALLPQGEARISLDDLDSEQRIYQISIRWLQIANNQNSEDIDDEMQEFTFRGSI